MSEHLPFDLPNRGEYSRKRLGQQITSILNEIQRTAEVGDPFKVVRDASDLPDPVNGFHELESEKIYRFSDEVHSDAGIDIGNNTIPLLGSHREHSWFVHTGEGTAIKGSGDIILNQLGVSAPNGTIFDIGGNPDSEFILNGVYIGVDDRLDVTGTIADLGTVDSFRGPELRVAGIRDFDSGLTFTGNYGRIYLEAKIRDIIADNVTCFEFTDTVSMASADIANCDFTDVQSDTVLFYVDPGATIDDIFNYRGNTHDTSTVTKSNILTGAADLTQDPYWVSDSHPLRESGVVGELHLDSETVTTISSQNTWYEVTGTTTEGNETERVTGDGNGRAKYIGDRDVVADVSIPTSWFGSNGDVYEFGLGKNGTIEPNSVLPVQGGGQNANKFVAPGGSEDLVTDDTISLMVRNTSGTNDVTIAAYNIKFQG